MASVPARITPWPHWLQHVALAALYRAIAKHPRFGARPGSWRRTRKRSCHDRLFRPCRAARAHRVGPDRHRRAARLRALTPGSGLSLLMGQGLAQRLGVQDESEHLAIKPLGSFCFKAYCAQAMCTPCGTCCSRVGWRGAPLRWQGSLRVRGAPRTTRGSVQVPSMRNSLRGRLNEAGHAKHLGQKLPRPITGLMAVATSRRSWH